MLSKYLIYFSYFSEPESKDYRIRKYLPESVSHLTGTQCDYCGKKFSSTWYMKTHVAAVHEETLKGIKCEEFGKSFALKQSLKRHLEKGACNSKIRNWTTEKTPKNKLELLKETINMSKSEMKKENRKRNRVLKNAEKPI